MRVTIVTASKGEGKTSFLRRTLRIEAERGRTVGGIAAPAVFERGERIGYDLLDLRRGTRRPFARVTPFAILSATVGRYHFDGNAVSEGTAAIISAVRDGLDLIAVDEVGPLEFRGEGWASALEVALSEGVDEQELVIAVRPSLSGELPRRFPSPAWTTATCVSPPWPKLPEV